MNHEAIQIYAWISSMLGVYAAMPANERVELHTWEKENLDGERLATSDWPGWEKYIGKRPRPLVPTGQARKPGQVYLVHSELNLYKIGQSKNASCRVACLATSSPVALELIHTIECDDRISAERRLHEEYSSLRRNGEWFKLSPEDVEQICGWSHYKDGTFEAIIYLTHHASNGRVSA